MSDIELYEKEFSFVT